MLESIVCLTCLQMKIQDRNLVVGDVSVNLALAVDVVVRDTLAYDPRVLDHVLFSEKLLRDVECDHLQHTLNLHQICQQD
jgi:hypothetical protein